MAKVLDTKPIGRPKAEEPSASISCWIPVKHYDRIIQLANKRDQSVSSLVRQLLILKLR